MAININVLSPRIADRRLFLAAAIGFPLLVLIGYARTYYLSPFFNVRPIANGLVHTHALVMSLWVAYFTAQSLLIRTKNVKLHMRVSFKRENVRRDTIEKPAVVRYYHRAAGKIFERLFKSAHSVYVEIVRRFVQENDVSSGF